MRKFLASEDFHISFIQRFQGLCFCRVPSKAQKSGAPPRYALLCAALSFTSNTRILIGKRIYYSCSTYFLQLK